MSADAPILAPARRVLSPQEMNAIGAAADYLAKARELAARLEKDAAEAIRRGREQGFREGYAAGRRAALEDLAEGVARTRDRLSASDEELAGIVTTALERLVGALDQTELARACVRHALGQAADDIWAAVRVCPEDHQALVEDLASLPLTANWPEIRGVEADPLLKRGEIVLETPKGRVHVGLKQQLDRLKAGLQTVES